MCTAAAYRPTVTVVEQWEPTVSSQYLNQSKDAKKKQVAKCRRGLIWLLFTPGYTTSGFSCFRITSAIHCSDCRRFGNYWAHIQFSTTSRSGSNWIHWGEVKNFFFFKSEIDCSKSATGRICLLCERSLHFFSCSHFLTYEDQHPFASFNWQVLSHFEECICHIAFKSPENKRSLTTNLN